MLSFRLLRVVTLTGGTVACAMATASACASGEEDLFAVPYYTDTDSPDASAEAPGAGGASSGSGGAPSTGGVTGTGGDLPPPATGGAPPVGSCVPEMCPAIGFGAPCCTPQGQCGIGLGDFCIAIPEAGAPEGPTGSLQIGAPVDCRSDSDCGANEVCCATREGGQYTSVECRATCDADSTSVGCSSVDNCSDGEVCCGTIAEGGNANYYSEASCSAECTGSDRYVLCKDDGECPGTTTCQESLYLPAGFRVCRR